MLLVPTHLRIAYINVVAIFWTNILSRTASTPSPKNGVSLKAKHSPILERLHAYNVVESKAFQRLVNTLDPAKNFVHVAAESFFEQLHIETTLPDGSLVPMDPVTAFPYIGAVEPYVPHAAAPKRRRRRRWFIFF